MQSKALNPSIAPEWLLVAATVTASVMVVYPGWPLIGTLGTLCLVGGALRWNWLCLALIFLIPLAPPIKTDLPFEDFSSILRILAALGVFLGYVLRREPLPSRVFRNKVSLILLLYLVVLAVSACKNGISHEAHRCLFHLGAYVAFYFGLLAWLGEQEQVETVVRTLVASSISVSLFAFYQFLSGGYGALYFSLYPDQIANRTFWDGRVASVFNYSNSLGGFMALVGALALATALLDRSSLWRKVGWLAVVFSAITILFSQSRGALAAFLGVMVLGILYFAQGWKVRVTLIALALIALMIVVPLLADFSRHLTVTTEDLSVTGRLFIFASAAQLFLHSPVLGVGYGNFRHLMDFDFLDLEANGWDAHNLYLQLLAESGILGFMAFGSLLASALWRGRCVFLRHSGNARLVGFATFAGLCSVLVHGFVDYLFNVSPQFGTLFWTVLALVALTWDFAIRGTGQGAFQAEGN